MKTWLKQFRASWTLDRHPRTSPPGAAGDHIQSTMSNLDKALQEQRPDAVIPPPSLHADILRAVRSAKLKSAVVDSTRSVFRPKLAPAAALVTLCLIAAVGWNQIASLNRHRTPPATSPLLTLASTALETGNALVLTAPASALSPLSNELQQLHFDLTNAQEYLYASLP